MLISLLVLEFRQFSFIRDRLEIWKSEIPPSEFSLISRDWGELWIPNFAQMVLKKATERCNMLELQLLAFLSY